MEAASHLFSPDLWWSMSASDPVQLKIWKLKGDLKLPTPGTGIDGEKKRNNETDRLLLQ